MNHTEAVRARVLAEDGRELDGVAVAPEREARPGGVAVDAGVFGVERPTLARVAVVAARAGVRRAGLDPGDGRGNRVGQPPPAITAPASSARTDVASAAPANRPGRAMARSARSGPSTKWHVSADRTTDAPKTATAGPGSRTAPPPTYSVSTMSGQCQRYSG